jgi:hypothetical protein
MKFITDLSKGVLGQGDSSELRTEITGHIPDEVLLNPDVKILSVACGHCTEAVIIAKRMIALGINKELVRNAIWLIDKYSVFTNYAKINYGFKNVITADFLEWNPNMRFDVQAGNPPFQETKEDGKRSDQASNLWTKFWAKSFDLSKPDGIIALITPTSWLSPSSDFRNKNDYVLGKDRLWDAFNLFNSYADVTTVKNHFPGIGSSFGYVVVNRNETGGLKFSDGASTTLGFLPKSSHDLVIDQLDVVENLGKYFKINQSNTPDIRVSIPLSRSLSDASIEVLTGNSKPTQGHESDERMYLYVHVDTVEQAKKVQDRLVSCVDIMQTHCRWAGFLNTKIVTLIKYEH